jgi:hypothetical protein
LNESAGEILKKWSPNIAPIIKMDAIISDLKNTTSVCTPYIIGPKIAMNALHAFTVRTLARFISAELSDV